jgi:hypothetical protein
MFKDRGYVGTYAIRPVVLVLALAWAAPATAHHLPVSTDWKIEQSLPVARAAFPTTCQPVTIRTDPEAIVELDARGIGGKFQPETCAVVVRPTLSPEMFCSTLVHEFGHAAGREHSPDKTNVMNPAVPLWGPCVALRQPWHFVAWTRELLAKWPSHRWACRGGGSKRVCVGRPVARGARLVGVAEFVRGPTSFEYGLTYRPRYRVVPRYAKGSSRSGRSASATGMLGVNGRDREHDVPIRDTAWYRGYAKVADASSAVLQARASATRACPVPWHQHGQDPGRFRSGGCRSPAGDA